MTRARPCRNCHAAALPEARFCSQCGQRLEEDPAEADAGRPEELPFHGNAYYSALFEQSAVAVAQLDSRTGRFLGVNPRYCELTQYSRDELLQLDFQTITHSADLAEDLQNMQLLRNGVLRTFHLEKRLIRKDGAVLWVDLTVVPLWPAGAPFDSHLAFVEDITVRKQTERELRESWERYSLLMDSVPAYVSYVDAEQRYRWVNKSYEQWYRRSREEIIGRTVRELQGEESYRQMQSHIRDALRGETVRYEAKLALDGSPPRRFDTQYVPHVSDDRRVLGFIVLVFDVTGQRAAEQSLRASEQRYRQLVELAPDGIVIVQEGRIVFANSMAAKLARAESAHQLLGACLNDYLHPDDLLASQERQAEMLAGRSDIRPRELRVRRLDGTYLTLEVSAGPCLHEERAAIQVIARDVSARKQTEQTLAILDFALNHVSEEVFLIDESARVHYANDQACRALECSREEVLKMRVVDIDPDFPEDRWSQHWRELATAGSQLFETRHRSKSGRAYPVEVSANYFEHEGRGWNLGMARNITERKRLEQSLRLAQFSLDRAVDSMFWVAPDATILYANDAACRTLGYAREELIGRAVTAIDPSFPAEAWPGHWDEIRSRGSFTFESDHRTKDGRRLRTEITTNLLRFEGQEYNCAMMRDITERKRAEDEMAALRDQLAHAARVGTMGELASGLAHELNQPLAALSLYASAGLKLCKRHGATELEECLQLISKVALRAGEIVRRMRSFVTRAAPAASPLHVGHLIHEVLAILGHELRRSGAKLDLRIDEGLPTVLADGIQIQQVLINLVRNALEAMAETTEGDRELRISAAKNQNGIRVSVTDTGCGIAPTIAANLFHPFQSTKSTGLGLGLAICRTLIEAHQGRIDCEPNPGGGTTFHFVLPIDHEHENLHRPAFRGIVRP